MIHFSKYHGCGNDFAIIDGAELVREGLCGADGGAAFAQSDAAAELARRICHRQLGVGADGLILAWSNPLTMDIINSDGSVAPMCGNGIRCFARHCLETGIVPAGTESFGVNTLAGAMGVSVSFAGGFSARVAMGRPDWSARAVGIGEDGEYIGRVLDIGEAEGIKLSSLFLGTYHTVVWLDENEWLCAGAAGGGLYGNPAIARSGRAIEAHPVFTNRTNVNFARVLDSGTVEMITWERGAGLTAACGTGASSVAALGLREGRLGAGAKIAEQCEIKVLLPYGELFISQGAGGEIFMRGPAEHVFDGEYYG
ncbi:MAG: diaminopimelate epimerase [Clostridiales Family XIII bacterium]|nr:diaminopimelate epimerase [Clostridiales Family XIII bacterium]